MKPAVLFARADSVYKTLDCDVWDIERDARNYSGNAPVVAHPPCRAWGQLRHMAKPREDEKELAVFAVEAVRRCGGVLEHPAKSTLWDHCKLPQAGEIDIYGGYTFPIQQFDFGHRAQKKTFLYIVGCPWRFLPAFPIALGEAPCIIGDSGRRRNGQRINKGDPGWRPEVSKAEREHTPLALAVWLLEVAKWCRRYD